MERALLLLLDTNILIDVLRGEAVALAWLESFPRLPLDGAIAAETVRLRQEHGLKIPDAIILATARCGDFSLATRNVRAFPLALGGRGASLPARGHSMTDALNAPLVSGGGGPADARRSRFQH